MGMFSKPKAPAAPDPTQTANAQYGYNKQGAKDTLNMNAISRYGPFGYSQFRWGGQPAAGAAGATGAPGAPGNGLLGGLEGGRIGSVNDPSGGVWLGAGAKANNGATWDGSTGVPGTSGLEGGPAAGGANGGAPGVPGTTVDYGTPTGIEQGFDPRLQGGFDNVMDSFTRRTAGMPDGINFDMMTAPAIAARNYGAYSALTAPQRGQERNAMNTMLAERGIPLGNEIDNNTRGNFYNSAFLADQNAAANAWNAVPGMQSTMTDTAIKQGMAPGALAGQSLGLGVQGLGLLPNAQQPQANVGSPDYSGIVQNNYTNAMRQYNADMTGWGNVLKGGMGLLAAPLTGGGSLFGMGMSGLGGLFNGYGGGLQNGW